MVWMFGHHLDNEYLKTLDVLPLADEITQESTAAIPRPKFRHFVLEFIDMY